MVRKVASTLQKTVAIALDTRVPEITFGLREGVKAGSQ